MKSKLRYFIFLSLLGVSACSNLWFEDREPQEVSFWDNYQGMLFAQKLPDPNFDLNSEIERELDHFTNSDRQYISGAVSRYKNEYSEVTEIWESHGMPRSLLSVALIESRFICHAKSHAGAVGLWQLMPATARTYGLKVNYQVDERRDPKKSTAAAAKLLRDLFKQFNNWELALAAYNAGPNRIKSAMAANGTTDFWTLAHNRKISYETRRFVAKVIAASMIADSPSRFGFASLALG